ncbi:hypothetical protein GCM10007967_04250 [Xylanimonas ulmi]
MRFRGVDGSKYGDVDSDERHSLARIGDAAISHLDARRAVAVRRGDGRAEREPQPRPHRARGTGGPAPG